MLLYDLALDVQLQGQLAVLLREVLRQQPEVLEDRKSVDAVNANLGNWETIKYFTLLPEDFTEQSGELSLKLVVKRKVVEQHYQDQIEAMYTGKSKPA